MQEKDPRLVIEVTGPQRSLADVVTVHPWVTTAREHLGPANTMANACAAVVAQLAGEWTDGLTALAGDPWLDSGFADRFTSRLRWLTHSVLQPGKLRLSDAESALLVMFPYLHQTFWTRQAATVLQGTDPVRAAFTWSAELPKFSTFAAGRGALHRRGARALDTGDPAATGIGWWLFHRWLVQQHECYDRNTVGALLPASIPPPLNAVLTPLRLTELMRAVQLDPAYLRRVDRPASLKPAVRIAGGSELEQDVREQLLGYLLVVAHRTAIEPTVLPQVIADHIGVDDGVTPSEVLTSIREAAWNGNRTRVLTTDCLHPATALALRHSAAAVDSVLTEIVRAAEDSDTLAPLKDMPVHASADGISAAASSGYRFRLANDQIQALLMGEQLYGKPELAIRELYQNALDACRYRQARTAYLTKTGTALPQWQGRISFRQAVDAQGRPFLECSDNGIGMGERELVDVFAHAGIRFTDMPEYVEEQADWASEGIESFPNSRFGIGVLSYFMLADEITVTTCRLGRDGSPGRQLEVHISGPDALFRVHDVGPGQDAGTTVRLRLRPSTTDVRCTDLLTRILWVSDFTVTSDDSSGQQTWEPRQLSATAPVGADDAFAPETFRRPGPVVAAEGGKVWWCADEGAILADGLWTGATTFGAVVDLSGPSQPLLTVDRQEIVDLDLGPVTELMRASTAVLLTSPNSPLSHSWLLELSSQMPRLADEICELAIDAGYRPWKVGDVEAPIEVVGCFPNDLGTSPDHGAGFAGWSSHVRRWRLAAWLRVEAGPAATDSDRIVPARPSDAIVLRRPSSTTFLGYVLNAALQADLSPAEVTARLGELGLPAPDPDLLPATATERDRDLLISDGFHNWLSNSEPVSRTHVLRAACATGLTPSSAARRLAELGYETSAVGRLPAAMGPHDLQLITADEGRATLLPDKAVPVAHIMLAAARSRQTPAFAAARLAELGYATPDPESLPQDRGPHDKEIFTGRLHTMNPHGENPVPRNHVILVAASSRQPPAQIVARLAEAGFRTSPGDSFPQRITDFDLKIMRRFDRRDRTGDRGSGSRPGPRPRRRSPFLPDSHDLLRTAVADPGHVVAAALETGVAPRAVARRLAELGYAVPAVDHLPAEVNTDDLELLNGTIGADVQTTDSGWLAFGQQLSLQHVVVAAARTPLSPLSVARRMAEFGFDVPPDELLRFDVRHEDLLLLSVNLDGKPPWLNSDHPALVRSNHVVPLGHVLAAAARFGKPPAEVAARLIKLGLRNEAAALPNQVERRDGHLLLRAVETAVWRCPRPEEFGWLSGSTPVNEIHLLVTAGRTGLTPAEVAARLSALGFAVADAGGLKPEVDEVDLKLLSEDLSGTAPYRDLTADFPREDVMGAVHQSGLLPGRVLERLKQLRIRVGE